MTEVTKGEIDALTTPSQSPSRRATLDDVIGAIEQRQRRLEIGLVTATGSRRAELLDDIRAVEELLVAFGATDRRPPGTLLN